MLGNKTSQINSAFTASRLFIVWLVLGQSPNSNREGDNHD